MPVTAVTTSGGWEGRDTWPHTTKTMVVAAFKDPAYASPGVNAPQERAKLYPQDPDFNLLQRHLPQLTWKEGTYDIPAHQGDYAVLCKYPNVATIMKGGRRECLEPGKLSLEESNAIAAKERAAWVQTMKDIQESPQERGDPCGGRTYGLYMDHKDASGYLHYYTCPAPGKFDHKRLPAQVRGLGETEAEKAEVSKLQTKYRTAELTLAAVLAAGLYLILSRR